MNGFTVRSGVVAQLDKYFRSELSYPGYDRGRGGGPPQRSALPVTRALAHAPSRHPLGARYPQSAAAASDESAGWRRSRRVRLPFELEGGGGLKNVKLVGPTIMRRGGVGCHGLSLLPWAVPRILPVEWASNLRRAVARRGVCIRGRSRGAFCCPPAAAELIIARQGVATAGEGERRPNAARGCHGFSRVSCPACARRRTSTESSRCLHSRPLPRGVLSASGTAVHNRLAERVFATLMGGRRSIILRLPRPAGFPKRPAHPANRALPLHARAAGAVRAGLPPELPPGLHLQAGRWTGRHR